AICHYLVQPGGGACRDLLPLSSTAGGGGPRQDGGFMNLELANRPRAYGELEQRFHRWTALKDGRAVLEWDQATMMPDGGAEARAEQIAALDVICHGILADPATGDLIHSAEAASGDLDPWQQANLAEMRRLWVHATALEPRLVEALAKSVGRAESLWRK